MLLSHSHHYNGWVRSNKTSPTSFFSLVIFSYGDIYPIKSATHFISMFASLLSLMMITILLSAVYSQYVAMREVHQMQVTSPEKIRYVIDDEVGDVTVQVNERLRYFNICRRL